MASKIQNEDIKSSAELVSAGGTAAQLPNDTKIYVTSLTKTLSAAISAGDIGGSFNYARANPGAEVNTTGWVTYADAAANKPVDMTGGSATGLTFSRSTSTPLRGSGQFSLVQTNSTSIQGKGVSFDYSIDVADQAKVLSVSFDFNASSTFVAGNGSTTPLFDGTTTTNAGNSDLSPFMYDVTNAVLIPISPAVITSNGANNFTFRGSFQASSNSTSYRFGLHASTTSANATGWTFLFDNVYIGPQNLSQGSFATPWASFTPTITGFGTLTTVNFKWRRVADTMEIEGTATAGTVTGSTFDLTLPNSNSIDTTQMTSTANIQKIGDFYHSTSGSTTFPSNSNGPFVMFYDGSTATKVYCANATTSQALTKATGSSLLSNSNPFTISLKVPIAGWSSTSLFSSDTDARVVAARTTNATATLTASYTDVTWTTVVSDTHGAFNATSSTTTYTIPVSGFYNFGGQVFFGGTGALNGTVDVSLFNLTTSTTLLESQDTYAGAVTTGFPCQFNFKDVQLTAGTQIKIQAKSSATLPVITSSATQNYFAIERVSGPATIAATDTVAARYLTTAGQSIANGASASAPIINFDTKSFDTHGAVTTGASWKFTAPVAGKYRVSSNCAFASGSFTSNNTMGLKLRLNGSGTDTAQNFLRIATTATQSQCIPMLQDTIQLVAGDFIDMRVYHDESAARTLSTSAGGVYIDIERIGN